MCGRVFYLNGRLGVDIRGCGLRANDNPAMDEGDREILLKNKIDHGHGQQRNHDPSEENSQIVLPSSCYPLRHRLHKWRRKRTSGGNFRSNGVKSLFNILSYLTTAIA